MTKQNQLFEQPVEQQSVTQTAQYLANEPLASRMRPKSLQNYMGQEHILSEGKPLYQAIKADRLHSIILWGPPGTGKTSLAKTIAELTSSKFHTLSAVMSGVKDIRRVMEQAKLDRLNTHKTILFVDEVHRFNKSQQDAFLPFVEDGTITFIGATTENPAFELNNALLSRARVYLIKPLSTEQLVKLLSRALMQDHILAEENLVIEPELLGSIAQVADGDARRALNLLEIAVDLAKDENGKKKLTADILEQLLQQDLRAFDKGGDLFYDQISALHKSIRGSSPDAALYWFCRMLEAGCDPLYLARRLVRIASEDVGNADPRALTLTISAWDTQKRLGSPEGELALAQAVVYLASAPKSDAVYRAFKMAMKDIKQEGNQPVPYHLRNAPTQLAKSMGLGEDYRHAHDEPEGYAAGVNYFPEGKSPVNYYQPVARGLEISIIEKLKRLRALDDAHKSSKN